MALRNGQVTIEALTVDTGEAIINAKGSIALSDRLPSHPDKYFRDAEQPEHPAQRGTGRSGRGGRRAGCFIPPARTAERHRGRTGGAASASAQATARSITRLTPSTPSAPR